MFSYKTSRCIAKDKSHIFHPPAQSPFFIIPRFAAGGFRQARTPAAVVAEVSEPHDPRAGTFSTVLVVVALGQNTVHVLLDARTQLPLLLPEAASSAQRVSSVVHAERWLATNLGFTATCFLAAELTVERLRTVDFVRNVLPQNWYTSAKSSRWQPSLLQSICCESLAALLGARLPISCD